MVDRPEVVSVAVMMVQRVSSVCVCGGLNRAVREIERRTRQVLEMTDGLT